MKNINRIILHFAVLLISFSQLSAQDGGMWIPSLVKDLNINDMQEMGLKLSAEELYSINHSSVKDAIVHFGGGCTAEVISNEGLLLTNHHCGYGQIQSHSTLENNYLKEGFWAKSRNEELENPGLTATFVIRIDDVTNKILEGTASDTLSEQMRKDIISENISKVIASTPKEEYQDVKVKPFFYGNQYFAFVSETYKDVRLVGAPPSMIGKYGSDTDNWVWPRHTADFSMFRIYASKDNKPAEYSVNNVPYSPKHFLPISLDGVEEGDFTMVYGFPGRTQEYLPAVAIEQLVDVINPKRIEIRNKALKIVDKEMRADDGIKIKYASKYAGIANYWKKWIGENKGLKLSDAVAKRKLYEENFMKKVNANADTKLEYGNLLSDFSKYYSEIEKYKIANSFYGEVVYRNVEILKLSATLNRIVKKYESLDAENAKTYFDDMKPRIISHAEAFYKNYESKIDEKVFSALIEEYMLGIDKTFLPEYVSQEVNNYDNNYDKLAENVFDNTSLKNIDDFNKLFEGSTDDFIKKLKKDKAFKIAESMVTTYKNKVSDKYYAIDDEISKLQRTYMKAQIELVDNRKFYPDANSTMRLTWGKVDGYAPKDGVYYSPKTTLDGVIEKYIPGDYEYDLPEKLKQLYADKDFGIYAEDGKVPVCFIATNHTTGGNSGSPALDANGNLVGLNFDRVWEGTMSDINYDANICRNIMVDAKYILFIIDKFGDARYLLDEMKLVRPKSELVVE